VSEVPEILKFSSYWSTHCYSNWTFSKRGLWLVGYWRTIYYAWIMFWGIPWWR